METLAIPDCILMPLSTDSDSWVLLSEEQHLLRRFGEVELVSGGQRMTYRARSRADEILIAISGHCSVELVDIRRDSPTRTVHEAVMLAAEVHKSLLIPNGVAYRIRGEQNCRLVRITTHANQGTDSAFEIPEAEIGTRTLPE